MLLHKEPEWPRNLSNSFGRNTDTENAIYTIDNTGNPNQSSNI